MKQVLCEVGNNMYGIDIEKVQGIERKLDIVQVPNGSSLVDGIANLRGSVIPILSLYHKFNIEPKPISEATKYIITRIGDMHVGFQVDMVDEIVEVPEDKFMEVPTIVANEDTAYIDSIIQVNKKLILVLDVEGILNEVEKKNISKLVEDM